MENYLNEYTDESLEAWVDNDAMDAEEAAFIRGTEMEGAEV